MEGIAVTDVNIPHISLVKAHRVKRSLKKKKKKKIPPPVWKIFFSFASFSVFEKILLNICTIANRECC